MLRLRRRPGNRLRSRADPTIFKPFSRNMAKLRFAGRLRGCPYMVPSLGSARRFSFFQGGVDGCVGADLVIAALSPALDGEIRGINSRNATFSYHDFAEDVAVHGHGRP